MSTAPHATLPPDDPHELDRLDAVRRYDILDTPRDGAFDRVTRLAARICGTPISTLTIVDTDRIWFKSTHGIEVEQIARDPGLCASAVLQLEPYVVTDAQVDPRTLDNPLVRGDLGLRFYAAVPLTTSGGHNLGTLNVIDVAPRELTDGQLESLRDLAGIVMDELELRLEARAQVAEEANREAARLRDAIVSGITHEMRTPLAVLKGTISLEESDADLDASDAAEIRRLRRRHLNHLDWLVQQFLDYSSLEGDQTLELDLVALDLGEVAEHAREVFDNDTPVTISIEDGPPLARADEHRTRQVVLELVNNAVRFGDKQPVEVAIRFGDDDTVEVAVTDHGRGIHRDDHELVFDKAFRGRDSTGSGLGLYVARVFAESQGGRIDVRSEPGQGSTFTLVLPRA